MFVIMDIEWFEGKAHKICPTQIAAMRIDIDWSTVAVFNELICPQKGVSIPLGHVSLSGAQPNAFMCAPSAHMVFEHFEKWLMPDDVLCWWHDEPAAKFAMLLKIIMNTSLPNANCILKPYFNACVNDGLSHKGSPYLLAQKRGIIVPGIEHCSMNDVITVQRLMRGVNISTQLLNRPVPDRSKLKKINSPNYLFMYDRSTNLLHAPESRCTHELAGLNGIGTVKTCLAKKYQPCPKCCTDAWKSALKAYNEEIVRQSKCRYFFFDNSRVFHSGTCRMILSAKRNYLSTAHYNNCIKSGRNPCKICKPVPEIRNDDTPKKPASILNMDDSEWRALTRYNQALKERSEFRHKKMSFEERNDMFTLTSPNYAFWAAHGYGTFHLRTCRKLNGLKNFKGFATFQQAVHAGYTPCRECKPSAKYNLDISMPINTKERADEKPEDILALCTRLGLAHRYDGGILTIYTAMAEWEIDTSAQPIVIYHMPQGSNDFHRQHKMFLSVSDAITYIAGHDGVKKPDLEDMLFKIRRKR